MLKTQINFPNTSTEIHVKIQVFRSCEKKLDYIGKVIALSCVCMCVRARACVRVCVCVCVCVVEVLCFTCTSGQAFFCLFRQKDVIVFQQFGSQCFVWG